MYSSYCLVGIPKLVPSKVSSKNITGSAIAPSYLTPSSVLSVSIAVTLRSSKPVWLVRSTGVD